MILLPRELSIHQSDEIGLEAEERVGAFGS